MISKRIVSVYINIALCTIICNCLPQNTGGSIFVSYSLSYKVDFITAFIDNMSGFKIYVYVYIDSKLWHCDHGDDLFNFIFK